jgi:hypothetical protein
MGSRSKLWIQDSRKRMARKGKAGSLKKMLGYKKAEKIPIGVLDKIVEQKLGTKVRVKSKSLTVTACMKKKANWARNVRK